jgi:hypothetical protein
MMIIIITKILENNNKKIKQQTIKRTIITLIIQRIKTATTNTSK